MKIGILSDTHGWLDPALERWFAGTDCLLHGGDVGSVAVLDALNAIAPTIAVRGNVDGGAWAQALPLEYATTLNGRRIAMCHIAGRPGRITTGARAFIARERPDLFLCGHSHLLLVQRVGAMLWLNPGAAGRQGWHQQRTAFLLTIEASGEMALDKIELGPRGRA